MEAHETYLIYDIGPAFYRSVSYSPEDNLYYGKIEHIDALVNYEGADLNELEHAFREAVGNHLAYCKG